MLLNETDEILADSSFYICFLDDIEQPNVLKRVLSKFDFLATPIVYKEVSKSTHFMRVARARLRVSTPIDPNHKARIFNNSTYYYVKTTNPYLFKKNRYVPVNAARLNTEFGTQSEYFLEKQNIDTLLNTKSMFKDEKAGNVLKELTSKSVDMSTRRMTDFI